MSGSTITKIECNITVQPFTAKHVIRPNITESAFGAIVKKHLENCGVSGDFELIVRQSIQGKRDVRDCVSVGAFDGKSIELRVRSEGPNTCFLSYLTPARDTDIAEIYYQLCPDKRPASDSVMPAPLPTTPQPNNNVSVKRIDLGDTASLVCSKATDEEVVRTKLPEILAAGKRYGEIAKELEQLDQEKQQLIKDRELLDSKIESKRNEINALKREREDANFKKLTSLFQDMRKVMAANGLAIVETTENNSQTP